jgi:ABC-type glycerol-3-phosphate transport system permease component
VLHILNVWNEFVWSNMVLIADKVRTLGIGLYYLQGVGTEYEQLATPGRHMAGYVIAAIPLLIVFLISMRSFVSGLTSGAIKV